MQFKLSLTLHLNYAGSVTILTTTVNYYHFNGHCRFHTSNSGFISKICMIYLPQISYYLHVFTDDIMMQTLTYKILEKHLTEGNLVAGEPKEFQHVEIPIVQLAFGNL